MPASPSVSAAASDNLKKWPPNWQSRVYQTVTNPYGKCALTRIGVETRIELS